MTNWTILKEAIANAIKTNGNREITGQVLQNVLTNIVSAVGENATFAGIAVPSTNPGVPDGPIFYLAYTTGAYVNFEGIEINAAGLYIIDNFSASSWTLSKLVDLSSTVDGMAELEKLVKGISIMSDASSYPQIQLGEFNDIEELNSKINALFSTKYCGRCRASFLDQNIDLYQYVIDASNGKYSQILFGNVVQDNEAGVLSKFNFADKPNVLFRQSAKNNGGVTIWKEWYCPFTENSVSDDLYQSVNIKQIDDLWKDKIWNEFVINPKKYVKYALVDDDGKRVGFLDAFVDTSSHAITEIVYSNIEFPNTGEHSHQLNVYVRYYNLSWSDAKLPDGTVWPIGTWSNWKKLYDDTYTEKLDATNKSIQRISANIINLGEFNTQNDIWDAAANIKYVANKDAIILIGAIKDQTAVIIQQYDKSRTMQYIYWDKKHYNRYIDHTESEVTFTSSLKQDCIDHIYYNPQTRIIYQRNRWNDTLTGGPLSTLPLATTSVPGLMSSADKQALDSVGTKQDLIPQIAYAVKGVTVETTGALGYDRIVYDTVGRRFLNMYNNKYYATIPVSIDINNILTSPKTGQLYSLGYNSLIGDTLYPAGLYVWDSSSLNRVSVNSDATTERSGLMSSADKIKIDDSINRITGTSQDSKAYTDPFMSLSFTSWEDVKIFVDDTVPSKLSTYAGTVRMIVNGTWLLTLHTTIRINGVTSKRYRQHLAGFVNIDPVSATYSSDSNFRQYARLVNVDSDGTQSGEKWEEIIDRLPKNWGKSCNFFGGSQTEHAFRENSTEYKFGGRFPLAKALGRALGQGVPQLCAAKEGAGFCTPSYPGTGVTIPITRQVEICTLCDMYVFWLGTVDYLTGKVFGNPEDAAASSAEISAGTASVVAAFKYCVNTLKQRNKDANMPAPKFFLITPTRTSYGPAEEPENRDLGMNPFSTDVRSMAVYTNTLKKVAVQLSIPILDLWKNSNLEQNRGESFTVGSDGLGAATGYFFDDTHLSVEGYTELAQPIADFIANEYHYASEISSNEKTHIEVKDIGGQLFVQGADDLLANGYIPVIFRKITSRNCSSSDNKKGITITKGWKCFGSPLAVRINNSIVEFSKALHSNLCRADLSEFSDYSSHAANFVHTLTDAKGRHKIAWGKRLIPFDEGRRVLDFALGFIAPNIWAPNKRITTIDLVSTMAQFKIFATRSRKSDGDYVEYFNFYGN